MIACLIGQIMFDATTIIVVLPSDHLVLSEDVDGDCLAAPECQAAHESRGIAQLRQQALASCIGAHRVCIMTGMSAYAVRIYSDHLLLLLLCAGSQSGSKSVLLSMALTCTRARA